MPLKLTGRHELIASPPHAPRLTLKGSVGGRRSPLTTSAQSARLGAAADGGAVNRPQHRPEGMQARHMALAAGRSWQSGDARAAGRCQSIQSCLCQLTCSAMKPGSNFWRTWINPSLRPGEWCNSGGAAAAYQGVLLPSYTTT